MGTVTSHPVAPVSCARLLQLPVGSETDAEVFESVHRVFEHRLGGNLAALPVLHELAATHQHRTGYVLSDGGLLRLWDMRVRCGALLALLLIGFENAPTTSFRLWTVADYVQAWGARRVTPAHAAWHIADDNPDPHTMRRHPARACSPDAYVTVWAMAGRTTDTDPVLGEALYWLRAVHSQPTTHGSR